MENLIKRFSKRSFRPISQKSVLIISQSAPLLSKSSGILISGQQVLPPCQPLKSSDDGTFSSLPFFLRIGSLPADTIADRQDIVRNSAARQVFLPPCGCFLPDTPEYKDHNHYKAPLPKNPCPVWGHAQRSFYWQKKTANSATTDLFPPVHFPGAEQFRQFCPISFLPIRNDATSLVRDIAGKSLWGSNEKVL